jgi:hypothetical protein
MSTSSYLRSSSPISDSLQVNNVIRIIVNKKNEIKQMTVATIATKVNEIQDKELLRVIHSLQEVIPGIMNFPVGQPSYTYTYKQKINR